MLIVKAKLIISAINSFSSAFLIHKQLWFKFSLADIKQYLTNKHLCFIIIDNRHKN